MRQRLVALSVAGWALKGTALYATAAAIRVPVPVVPEEIGRTRRAGKLGHKLSQCSWKHPEALAFAEPAQRGAVTSGTTEDSEGQVGRRAFAQDQSEPEDL